MKFPSIKEAIRYFELHDRVDTSFGNRLHQIYLKDVSVTGQAVIFEGALFMAAFPDMVSPKLFLWDCRTNEPKLYLGGREDSPWPIHNIVRAMLLGICPTQILEHELNDQLDEFWEIVHSDLIALIGYADEHGVYH
jgi:hypothetical protein